MSNVSRYAANRTWEVIYNLTNIGVQVYNERKSPDQQGQEGDSSSSTACNTIDAGTAATSKATKQLSLSENLLSDSLLRLYRTSADLLVYDAKEDSEYDVNVRLI